MLRYILSVTMLFVTFSSADMATKITYDNLDPSENLILELKLEIYKLREKNAKLQKVIDSYSLKTKEEQRRTDAIAQLKRDLRNSRKTKNQQVMLLR